MNTDSSRPDPIEQVELTVENAASATRRVDAFWASRVVVGPALLVALVLVVILGAVQLLPHSQGVRGFDVLFYTSVAQEQQVSLPSRIFVTLLSAGTVLFGAITVITQRWWAAGIAWCATCVAAIYGVLAIWLRQDGRGPNPDATDFGAPAIGIYLSEVLVIALAITFSVILWVKSDQQKEAEAEVREEARRLHEARIAAQKRTEPGSGALRDPETGTPD